ncbi:tetratricopeptide repeat protein [Granulicella cerasi]|uniref:Tetratricopeptide repeat protein n=1 Tax=Granulicella cerasi TaxID=741063 RepID=A0ABW1ZDK6_9BACT|nr:tetratricopeptide repeat protein [Granulicella cerasi]
MAAYAQAAPEGRVVLVLPFENRSGNASLNWVGDSFPDTLDKRLNSSGFLTISQDDRRYALDHLGLPKDFRPSRATTIKIAQQLDANYVVIGSFNVVGQQIRIQSQVLTVNALKLSAAVEDSAELNRLFDAENAVAWKIARAMDPKMNVAEQTFLAAPGAVPLPAFENYIRGTNAPTPNDRLARLKEAVSISPNYAAALLALGKEQYAAKDFAAAATTLAKVPQDDPLSLEAGFYLGLARINNNNYTGAATAFDFVESRLPLPEVLNNHGVALARQGKDGSAYFDRAVKADPNDVDFRYNLAVSLFRRGDTADALREADAALKLKNTDGDIVTLRSRIAAVPAGTKLPANDPTFAPAERVRRSYSEASFRQAAFQLSQLQDMRLAMLPPAQRANEHNSIAQGYMQQGLLPQAEQQYNAALEADGSNAAAHAGLAEIRERSGQKDEARNEAQASIRLKPNVPAYLVLARLEIAAKNVPAAVEAVNHATALEPHNPQAIALRMSLQKPAQ